MYSVLHDEYLNPWYISQEDMLLLMHYGIGNRSNSARCVISVSTTGRLTVFYAHRLFSVLD